MKLQAPRIGVVLSSGGVRGVYAHTGFLLALERFGIEISAAVGCSAGAVVGAVAASGADLHAWADTIAMIDRRRFWTSDPLPVLLWRILAQRGRGYTGLSGTEAAVAFCRSQVAVTTFEACRYPFSILAVNLTRSEEVIFSTGELGPRMAASAAVPLWYRPVEVDGELYCDGAVVDLAPANAICCHHGLDAVLIHYVAARPKGPETVARLRQRPWAMLEILDRALLARRPWYLSDQPLTFHRCPCVCGAGVIVIEPELSELRWPMTAGGPEVQAEAMAQTEALLGPHLDALRSDPRRRLPNPARTSVNPTSSPVSAPGCGSPEKEKRR